MLQWMRVLGAALLTAALVLASATGRAHGAFPQARQILRDPSAPNRLWVRSTYGVLRSDDLGASWSWLCTLAAGFPVTEDPVLGVSAAGHVLTAQFAGVLASKDLGCTWAVPQVELGDIATGIAVDLSNPNRVAALLAHGKGDGTFQNDVWESQDGGETFVPLALDVDASALLISIALAPSDPKRLYLSGFLSGSTGPVGVVFRSDDGKAFQKRDLGTPPGAAPTLLGVHPTDPDTLYLKLAISDGAAGSPAEHALLFSTSGGDATAEALRKNARLFGFAFTPGGGEVFVGFGDPKGGVEVSAADLGLYRSTTAAKDFTKVHDGHVGCATFVEAELWACLSQSSDGFEIGRSSDGGLSFKPVMQLTGIEPLSCGSDTTVGQKCGPIWSDVCGDVGKCVSGPDAGTGGAGRAQPAGDAGGCACRSAPRSSVAGVALGLALLSASLLRRRR